jgi:hypothetical protein
MASVVPKPKVKTSPTPLGGDVSEDCMVPGLLRVIDLPATIRAGNYR